ncbi:peptidase [Methylobacterium sp. Leaf466]|nr:peptidase [Methylobacterium sp. Leaf466]
MVKVAKRWLILGHRWLGIGAGLLVALWIGSGLVMLHVPFPRLSQAERLARLPPIAWDRVAIAPDAALAAAGQPEPAALGLEMQGGEPVYRVTGRDGGRATVSARTGERRPALTPEEARALAGAGTVEPVARDQWTVTARYDPLRPFHKVALADAAGTEVYVSAPTGEVALVTTRFERGWNWVGAVVHWVYPTPLRARPDLWRDVVLWLSGLAIPLLASGLVLGIWRLGWPRRYRNGALTPYRGLARWHHLSGLAGGLALTGFLVSGWLSMNPNRWFTGPAPPAALVAAQAGPWHPVGLDPAGLRRVAAPDAVALRFTTLGGRPLVVSLTREGRRVMGADGGPGPDEAQIVAAAMRAMGQAAPPTVERLTAHDAHWSGLGERPLPMLRLRFADPAATWLHVDPRDGTIAERLDRSGRAYRWLFDGLHRLDFFVLAGPARELAQWALNLLGAVVVISGLVAGWRRVGRRLWG